jgi:hypothetical protein
MVTLVCSQAIGQSQYFASSILSGGRAVFDIVRRDLPDVRRFDAMSKGAIAEPGRRTSAVEARRQAADA